MQTWACGHEGKEGHSRLCPHLVGADAEDVMHFRVLRGKGIEADFCCNECSKRLDVGELVKWLSVCAVCAQSFNEAFYNLAGWIGQPEIKEHLIAFNAALDEGVLPDEITRAVALAPLDSSRFMALRDQTLLLIDREGGIPMCVAPLADEKDISNGGRLMLRLHVSPCERFVVVCHDYGRYGLVVDLEEKRVTMLDKGDYRYEHTPFPAAFFIYNGRTLLAHATNWNRLDVSDPSDGALFSARQFPPGVEGQRSPEHYSGLWQGRLHISPTSEWIADDQWCWGPAGEVTAWNLVRWMEENVWESEDGETRQRLCQRLYLWNIPVAWVSNQHLAVWGIGYDDEAMLSGARVFDVTTGEETATFAGPSKNAFFGGEGRLFSVEEDGLHIWDAGSGERLGRINGFKPRWQRGDLLIELNDNRVRSWNWRAAFD